MDAFETLLALAEAGRCAEMVTLVRVPADRAERLGQMLVLPVGEKPAGLLIDEGFTECVVRELQRRPFEKPELFTLPGAAEVQLFRDRLELARAALVLGAGHISQPLVEILAMTGYAVTVADDRPDFANESRFPRAERVVCGDFRNVLAGLDSTAFAAIVIVTRGHRYDLDCLRLLLRWEYAGYLGMIGSRRRVGTVLDVLVAEGVGEEKLRQLRAPVGLDIGAQTPEEIAVSIVAEIIAEGKNVGHQPLRFAGGGCRG